jgi:hypothetical protein
MNSNDLNSQRGVGSSLAKLHKGTQSCSRNRRVNVAASQYSTFASRYNQSEVSAST